MHLILDAAAKEFNRAGYTDATTSRIAQAAGVTEAQMFRYFDSKADLFRSAVFIPLSEHLSRFIQDYMPEDLAYSYTTDLQRFIRENIGMFTSLVVVQTYGAGAAKGFGEVDSLSAYFERGAKTLQRWVPDHQPRVDPKLMVRVSFVAVLACLMFEDWIFPEGMATREEITAAINEFVMHGISAVKLLPVA